MATKEELQQKAADLDIEGRSQMNKDELEAAIADAEGGDTASTGDAPALDNNVRGKIDRSPGTPTQNELYSGLQGWANDQIAAGATTEDVKKALTNFKLEGSAAGVVEKAEGPVGQWGVKTHPADWEEGEPALA